MVSSEGITRCPYSFVISTDMMTRSFSIQSEILLEQGVIFNILMLYDKAIQAAQKILRKSMHSRFT